MLFFFLELGLMDYHIYLSLFFLSVTFLLVHVFLQVTGNKNSHKIHKKQNVKNILAPIS